MSFKTMRKEAKLTQEELARRISVSVDTVRRWEKNKFFPSLRYIAPLARVLRVSEDRVFREVMIRESSNA